MKVLDDVCDILEDELKEIVRTGEMSPQILDNTYKAVDIIKDITTIKAMKESEYGGGSYGTPYYDDYSMARNRDNNRMMERGDYRHRGYSRDDEKENLMKQMEDMKRQLDQMKR